MPDTLPRPSATAATAGASAGALTVVEAATAEQALEEVHRRHGAAARIVQAEKVLRGGVAGFFQRELVQLTVDLESGGVEVQQRPITPGDVHDESVGRHFLEAVQDAMARDEQDGAAPPGETFAELLDRAVGPQAPDGSLATGPLAEEPAATDEVAATGGIDAALARLTAEADAGDRRPDLDAALARLTAEADAGDRRPDLDAAWWDALPRAAGPTLPSEEVSTPAPHRSPEQLAEDELRCAGERMRAAVAASVATAGTAPTTGPSPTPRPGPTAPATSSTSSTSSTSRSVSAAPAPSTAGAADELPPVWSAQERPTWAGRVTTPDGPWSLDGLVRLGLPRALVAAVDAQRPIDDLAWIGAVAAAVDGRCGELPTGRAVLVGRSAPELADARGVEVCEVGDAPPVRGHVALEAARSQRTARWLDRALGSRWLEVVAGGEGWRDWLWDGPAAVSWATPSALPDALAAAVELDLPLGHCPAGGRAVRATPVEVALGLRALLEARS